MNLAGAISAYIEGLGISHVFGVSGASIEHLFHAMAKRDRVKVVLAKHETSAVTMAEGYFRRTGQLGIAMVTSGTGAFHTVPALAEALSSGIPLLVVVGQIARGGEGRGAFQDSTGRSNPVNAAAIFATNAVAVEELRDARDAGVMLDRLVAAALEKRGPSVLLVPRDVLAAEHPEELKPQLPLRSGIDCDKELAAKAAAILSRAKRTLFILGKDVAYRSYREPVSDLVRRCGARVAVTADGKALWDHDDPAFVGVVGVMGHDSAHAALAEAEVVVAVGTSLPVLSQPNPALMGDKVLITVNHRASFVDERTAPNLECIALIGDGARGVELLLQDLVPQDPPPRQGTQSVTMLAPPSRPSLSPQTLTMRGVIDVLAQEFVGEVDVFVDAGNTGAAAIHYWQHRNTERLFSVALGMGGMGHSFGCAIGSTFASGRRGLVLAGDGAFYMYGMEIHTAWQYRLPIIFVIFNNNAHAMCHVREQVFLGEATGDNLFRPSAIGAGIAAMLPGILGFDVDDSSQLETSIKAVRNADGPSVISINLSADEMPPFRAFFT